MVEPLWGRDAWALADDVRARRVSARELLDVHLARIEALDEELNAFCHLDADGARYAADGIDQRIKAGDDPGPLAGVPLGVKELHDVAGMPSTHGSLVYRDHVATHDSIAVARLRAAGAVIVGKTTSPEFGSMNFTRTFLHGVTRNPWNPERTPGGSSGGSAAAVAAGMVPVATGGDGGGSIRIPSAYCGLFGFRATFGRIPEGPGSFDSSLTSMHGPMVRSVRDAARYVDVTAGPSATDPTSLPKPSESYERIVVNGEAVARLQGRRATWSATLGYAVADPEVEKLAYTAAVALCDAAGIELIDVPVNLPKPGGSWGMLSSIDLCAEHLEAVRTRLDEITPFVRRGFQSVMEMGAEVVARAVRRRAELIAALAPIFEEVDFVLTPTTATTAFVAEGPPPTEIAGRPVGLMGATPFTAPFNLTMQPAASIPAGFIDGLPVGLHVVGRRHEDDLVLGTGALMEHIAPWPKLADPVH
jgi:aspartyl-tRNA(Asn)/glutamyl-tRNA(Gln) amidotransferase subunit A